MKEIIRNINFVIFFLIITPSVFAFFKVDPDVLSDVTSNYVDGQISYEIKLDRNPENPKYFCQKDVAKVMRNAVLSESRSALGIKKLKYSNLIKNVKTFCDCWLDPKAKNCPFFYWNSNLGTCSVSNENTRVCNAPSRINCFKNESSPELDEGSLIVRTDKCQECNDLILIKSVNFQCAALNDCACYFDNLCKNINLVKMEESGAFNQKRKARKETVVVNVKRVVECWNLCQNCSFLSWDTKSLSCHFGELVKQQE